MVTAIAQGRGIGSALDPAEASRIVELIRPHLDEYIAKYDERKYPPVIYERLLRVFRAPRRMDADDIRQAILWKFGHLRKRRIPAHHERLISELQRKWPKLIPVLAGSAEEVFTRMTVAAGRHRYITVSFLLHLLMPLDIPIIDQHNFRAMNHYFKAVRSGWRPKSKPRAYEDLTTFAAFLRSVLGRWKTIDPLTVPSEKLLDQYLMMFGKALKARRRRSQSAPNSLQNLRPRAVSRR
jgi:hypothetical protein